MIGLFAIIVHYGTIIRYYCAYYCTYYCTYYGTWVPIIRYYCTYYSLLFAPIIRYYCSLFFLLFSIMVGCRHPKNGNVQTAILKPNHGGVTGLCRRRMPAQLHRLEGAQTEWKAA